MNLTVSGVIAVSRAQNSAKCERSEAAVSLGMPAIQMATDQVGVAVMLIGT